MPDFGFSVTSCKLSTYFKQVKPGPNQAGPSMSTRTYMITLCYIKENDFAFNFDSPMEF